MVESATLAGGDEDRLTEVFATAVNSSAELCGRLFSYAGAPSCDRYEVETQPRLSSAQRPDMRVVGYGAADAPAAVVWFEHKLRSGFSERQREKYAEAISDLPGDQRLLVIVHDISEIGSADSWTELTWQQVAEFAAETAEAAFGPDWRAAILTADVAAKWRLLAELLWYLERKERVAVTAPLGANHVLALSLLEDAELTLDRLVDRAFQLSAPTIMPAKPKPYEGWGSSYHHLRLTFPTWLEAFGEDSNAELAFGASEEWTSRRKGFAYGAGFALPERFFAPLTANRDWVESVGSADFTVGIWDGYCVIYRTLLLEDLVMGADSLADQARRLSESMVAAVSDLAKIPAELNPLAVPPAPRRSRTPR